MKILFLILSVLPTIIEAWLDRKGEDRKGKIKDTLWLVVGALGLSLAACFLKRDPLPLIGLLLGFRIACFDPLVHALLKKHSENHHNINIWTYTGKSTKWWDQWVANVPWRIAIVFRAAILTASIVWFFVSF